MKKVCSVSLTLFLLMSLLSVGVAVSAAGSATLTASNSTVAVGDQVTITATFNGGGSGIGSLDATFRYNTSAFEYVSCTGATVNGGAGTIKIAYYATAVVAPESVTVTLTFKAIAAGTGGFQWTTEGMYDDEDRCLLKDHVRSVTVSVASSASTPDSQVIEAYAGDTVQIRFVEGNCYGVAGSIQYSNRNLFASVTPGGSTSYGKITDTKFILSSMDKMTFEVVLTVKISEYAKVGDTCVVSFTDCELIENIEDFSGRSGYTKTVTVKVISQTTAPVATTTSTTAKPTKPTAPTTTTTTTTKPSGTTNPALDYTKLIREMEIANSLHEIDWTAESWSQLNSGLSLALDVLYSAHTQKEINDALVALEQSIAGLVPVDDEVYASKLLTLMEEIQRWLEDNDENGVLADGCIVALEQAETALVGGDQIAIDEAYDNLLTTFNALKDEHAHLATSTTQKSVSDTVGDRSDDADEDGRWDLVLWIAGAIVLGIGIAIVVVMAVLREKFDHTKK